MSHPPLHGVSIALIGALSLTLWGASAPSQAVLLHDGLVSYWRLNEGSGDTAADTGPGGFVTDNGQLRNGPTWINGQFGAGLQFSGTQDVLIPASSDMDINSSAVTLSAWVKLDQLPSEIAGGFSGIYDSGPDNYVLYLDKGSNELRFKATTTDAKFERPGIFARHLDTTNWHHVMGVYDGSKGAAAFYFNGELVDQASHYDLLNKMVRTGQVASIGGQAGEEDPHNLANPFHGGISDVAVWNRALGLAEARYLYNNGAGNAVGAANPNIAPVSLTPVQPSAQPVIYYNFNGNLNNHGTGGAAYNATLHDVPGRNDNLYSTSEFGQGLDLRENPDSKSSVEEGGDYLSVDYTLADSGTIAMRVQVGQLYNFNALWSNSSHENDWEAWVYVDGRVATRGTRNTDIMSHNVLLTDDGGVGEHHYAYAWERLGDRLEAKFYVDGELQGAVNVAWQDPGATFFIGGGTGPPNANHLGNALFDEVRIYETALTQAEILFLAMNAPETVFLTGDYNGDGIVDAADYVVWRNTLNTNVTAGTGADGNNNGMIDVEDYNLWKQNYGKTAGQAGLVTAAAVPEPATLVVALLATVGLWAGVRRHAAA